MSGSYSRSGAYRLNKLPEAEATISPLLQITLTEGAIGYRHFDVRGGGEMMAVFSGRRRRLPTVRRRSEKRYQRQLGTVTR